MTMRVADTRRTAVVLALLLVSGQSGADSVAFGASHSETPKDFRFTYTLHLHSCPISLQSRAGGYTALQSTDNNAGYYSHEKFAKALNLAIDFNCIQERSDEFCPHYLAIKEEDPSTRRLMQEVHYSNIHPLYYGEAHASTLTAVPPPRTRVLAFCIGDERRTLAGRAIVGNERRAVTNQVLRILKTIRFTDAQDTSR